MICTADAHATIGHMKVLYDATTTDHFPIEIGLDTDSLPEILREDNAGKGEKVDWTKLSSEDRSFYNGRSDELLSKIQLPMHAILCTNVNCKNSSHCVDLCEFYNCIVYALVEASKPLLTHYNKAKNIKPGWNKFVAAPHAEAKAAHKAWVMAGRPRQGPVLEHKKLTNLRYKYAVRFVGKNEQAMRADLMAGELLDSNVTGFWNQVKNINRGKTSLPSNIEGVSGGENITELWRQHYAALFNCIKSEPYSSGKVEEEMVHICPSEISQAIKQLADGKACGLDNITAEHLKLASPRVAVLLSICFTGLVTHGILPDAMLTVVLVPVIKDKAGKVGSMDNYRPIALASILSKVLERVLIFKLGDLICTTDNQFGFKSKHSTDMCIYALKEAVEKYRGQGSTMLVGFIDASRAFDRVNHHKLFIKLEQRGVPRCIIRILAYWYDRQTMQVKWGNILSSPFKVGNGVRQGGLLSPSLFSLYMDGLSRQLRECRTGCIIGNTIINHIMYADDLAIISPSSAGFQQLLNICSDYGVRFDIKYNDKKSVVMICRTKEDKHLNFPGFHLSGQILSVCSSAKYLGHIINDKMEDDADMLRQRRMMYVQANVLVRKFHYCSDEVKVNLFRAYCTHMYTAHLWVRYKKESLRKLQVAYNDCLRILLKKPRGSSASKLFCELRVTTFHATLRGLMYKCIGRLQGSQNVLIIELTNPRYSSVRYQSYIWSHWYMCLYCRRD